MDHWLEHSFDGHALITVLRPGEVAVDTTTLESIREQTEAWRGPAGEKRVVARATVEPVGTDGRKGLVVASESLDGQGARRAFATEVYVPTGGRMLILGMWSWDTSATDVAEGTPPSWSRGLVLARLPSGPERRGETILYAIVVGIGFAGLLVFLRSSRITRAASPS